MFYKRLVTPALLLAASLGALLFLVKIPLATVFYPNPLAHSFTLLAITAVLFFVYFFSYQTYAKEKDIRWYVVSLAFYVLGFFGFLHAVLVPSFGWGNEELFDISEHYGFFLASLLLWGLIIPFSSQIQERIYQTRTKIFLGLNLWLSACFVLLFFLPPVAGVLFNNVDVFIGLTGINFLLLLIILLTRKQDNFFTSSLPNILVMLLATNVIPLFYREWNLAWWYYHFLWLSGSLLLLLLLLLSKKGKDITEILFSSFSIRTRLFFIVGLTLVAIAVNGLIDFRLSQNHLQTQTLENLVLIADVQEGQVLGWLDTLKGRAVDFTSDGFIRERLKKIIAGDQQAVVDLNWHLLENKLPLDSAIFGIHVMDLNGKVVASSQGNEVGKKDMAMDDGFIQARGSRYGNVYTSDIVEDDHFGEKNIAIMATAPIIDQTKSENIGVMMLFFKTQGLSNILTGKAQSQSGALSTWSARKKTLEMYLVNEDKVMASESKFIINATLKEKVDTVPVRLCAKSEEMSGEYLDYREIPVFGASMCLPSGWTLLAEIDKDEVLATLGDYFQQNLLSASATFLLILFTMYLFTISVISPLKELSAVAQKIGASDFTARAERITRDEFGELSMTFNQMAENIQKGNVILLQKAKEEEISRLAVTNILSDLEVAKKELEQAKAKDEAILNSIGDGLIIIDKQGIISAINPRAEEMIGWNAKDLLGKPIFEAIPMEDEENKFIPAIRRALDLALSGTTTTSASASGQAIIATVYFIRKDKTKFPVAVTTAPIRSLDGSIIGVVAIFRDITKEKEIDKAKTEFVSLASHQLRTPLSTINWYLEMLMSEDKAKLNDDQKEYAREAALASKRLVALVNALLNVSRIEMGTFTVIPESISIAGIIKSCVKEFEHKILEKELEVTQEYDPAVPKVMADPKLLDIVCQNLLENAINYTPSGGKIKVSLKGKGSDILVVVEDSGIGIPKIQQPKIFIKMFRADNAREIETNGNGLGLYMTKAIIDHSGGRIWFESPTFVEKTSAGKEEGKGTTFYITIPISGMKAKEGTKSLT